MAVSQEAQWRKREAELVAAEQRQHERAHALVMAEQRQRERADALEAEKAAQQQHIDKLERYVAPVLPTPECSEDMDCLMMNLPETAEALLEWLATSLHEARAACDMHTDGRRHVQQLNQVQFFVVLQAVAGGSGRAHRSRCSNQAHAGGRARCSLRRTRQGPCGRRCQGCCRARGRCSTCQR